MPVTDKPTEKKKGLDALPEELLDDSVDVSAPAVDGDAVLAAWTEALPKELKLAGEAIATRFALDMREAPALPPRPKEMEDHAETTRVEYTKVAGRIRVLLADASPLRVLLDAAVKGRSSYYTTRAVLREMIPGEPWERLDRCLPPYRLLCRLLGREPAKRTGEITRARRRRKDPDVLEAVLRALPRDLLRAVAAIRATGCRVSELPLMTLSREEGLWRVTLPLLQAGCRDGNEPAVRRIRYRNRPAWLPKDAPERPFAGLNPRRLQNAWYRARLKAGITERELPQYSLAGLRHEYASNIKALVARSMTEKYGEGWNRMVRDGAGHLAPACPDAMAEFDRQVRVRLGRGSAKSAQRTGNSRAATKNDV
jgi:hypothetical protein